MIAMGLYSGNQFQGADDLWLSTCERIENFILDNRGEARSTARQGDTHLRVNWEEVNDVVNGRKPISELKCN